MNLIQLLCRRSSMLKSTLFKAGCVRKLIAGAHEDMSKINPSLQVQILSGKNRQIQGIFRRNYANRYVTYRIPDLQEGPKVMFNFLKGHTKPFMGTLVYIVAIQLAASSILTYFEMKNNITIRQKINELEQRVCETP